MREAPQSPTKTAQQVENALWLYAFLIPIANVVSWAVFLYRAARGTSIDVRPLFTRHDEFRDLTNYASKTAHLYHGSATLGAATFPIYNYPPLGAFVFKALLYTVPGHAVRTDLVLLAVSILCFALVAWRAVRGTPSVRLAASAAITVTAGIGYPLIFAADRGNIEWVVFTVCGAGLCLLLRGRYTAAAILIGIAGCIKPFSLLFLLLLMGRRKFKEVTLALAVAGTVTLALLIFMGPNPLKAYQNLKPGLALYTAGYITSLRTPGETRFDHSLFGGMKSAALTVEIGGIDSEKTLQEVKKLSNLPGGWSVPRQLWRAYPLVAMPVLIAIILVSHKKPMLNELTALAVAVAILPPVGPEYNLLQLYVPFGALLVFLTREVSTRKVAFPRSRMYALLVIYALLFSPLTFLRVYAGDAKLLLLIVLLAIAVVSPMRSSYFDELPQEGSQEHLSPNTDEPLVISA